MRKACIAGALAALLAAGGCSDNDSVPSGDPRTGLNDEMRGYFTKAGLLVAEKDTPHWVQSALKGYEETSHKSALPAKVVLQDVKGSCTFRKPKRGEHVGNVHIGGGVMSSPFYAWSRADVAERAKTLIKNAQLPDGSRRKLRDDRQVIDEKSDVLRAVDVVVTETSKPVYLVLQHEFGKVLWNIHLAPGAQISHVAALGPQEIAVANLDETVPIEVAYGKRLESCGILPRRKPQDHWHFMRNAKNSGGALKDIVEENLRNHRNYSRWFASSFGMASEEGVVGVERSAHVLVGPLPTTMDSRVPFRPIEGSLVRMTSADNISVSTHSEYESKQMAQIRALVDAAVGKGGSSQASGS